VTKKVLITGSRDFEDGQVVLDAIASAKEWAGDEVLLVIQGAARGADTLAHIAATHLSGVLSVAVPADWANDGKSAGPIRNQAMLSLNPDVVLAFYKMGAANRGTQNCVDAATALGIPVKVYQQ